MSVKIDGHQRIDSGASPTFAGQTVTGLTASKPVGTDANKALASLTTTGTGAVALATSPAFTTPNIGAATASTINLTGGQIAFPATQAASADANTLDDYEEGTWTIGVAFGGGTTGITYNATYRTGYYVKIGRKVFINGFVILTSKGSSNGDATITGLPFTAQNTVNNYSAFALRLSAVTFATWPSVATVVNTTTLDLRETDGASGVQTTITDANFADTSYIMVGGSYDI